VIDSCSLVSLSLFGGSSDPAAWEEGSAVMAIAESTAFWVSKEGAKSEESLMGGVGDVREGTNAGGSTLSRAPRSTA
jgi:hypothetical protein